MNLTEYLPRESALAVALDYAARGFAVFPCLEGRKEPACGRGGFHNATTNPATIRRWWSGIHNYNIAIATGLVSGVWVLDVDGSNGAVALAELEAEHGALPTTMTSVGESGAHLWFKMDGPLQCSVARVGHGLDVRADGGYAMVPPSVHPDGPIYRWTNDRPPAIAPAWLVKLARQRPGAPKIVIPEASDRRRQGSSCTYGQAALEYEIAALAKTAPGGRNHALNRASFSLHQLVAGGELDDAAEVRRRLVDACHANGLMQDDGPRQVNLTIWSGAKAGLQHPRSRPQS
jgi:hypothetical protein